MILTSPVIKDIEVEHGTNGISLSQDGENILMSADQLKQFMSAELATLREAGEKMAEALRISKEYSEYCKRHPNKIIEYFEVFNMEDADALEAWEAANK